MDLRTRQAFIRQMSPVYLKASKKEKGRMLDQVVIATGYHRFRASWLLTNPPVSPKKKLKRKKISKYAVIVTPLKKIYGISNFASGKRLIGMIPSYVETLVRDRELFLTKKQVELLNSVSAATIERLIQSERKKVFKQGLTTTKPGTLLKNQIPIHLFTQWDDRKPGFGEIDLVAHCGPSAKGDFAYTLDYIDLDTNWDECVAFLGKGQHATREGLKIIRGRLPFALLGIDSDNGDEFINWHLYYWCKDEQITFTRGREYRKNDQAHVE